MEKMTLDYNVDRPKHVMSNYGEKRRLISEFVASKNDCAKVNLFGRQPYSVSAAMRRIIDATPEFKEAKVSCHCSSGEVFLLKNK